MSAFTKKETEYLAGQLLCRMATVDTKGRPHVVPVNFRVDPETDEVRLGGHNMETTKKYRNVVANGEVALVIDDLASIDPWFPRGIEIRGNAEIHDDGGADLGPGFGDVWLRVVPTRVVAWGIDTDPFAPPNARTVR